MSLMTVKGDVLMTKPTYSVEVVESNDDLLWVSVFQVQTDGRRSLIDSRSYDSLDDGFFWAHHVILDFIGDQYA
jgi:hypothetical protein